MPKLKLKFKLPEEELAARDAMQGELYAVVLKELDKELREITKFDYNTFARRKPTKEEAQLAEQIRDYLREQGIDELWR